MLIYRDFGFASRPTPLTTRLGKYLLIYTTINIAFSCHKISWQKPQPKLTEKNHRLEIIAFVSCCMHACTHLHIHMCIISIAPKNLLNKIDSHGHWTIKEKHQHLEFSSQFRIVKYKCRKKSKEKHGKKKSSQIVQFYSDFLSS